MSFNKKPVFISEVVTYEKAPVNLPVLIPTIMRQTQLLVDG